MPSGDLTDVNNLLWSKLRFSVKAKNFHKMMTNNLFCQGRDLYGSAVKAGKRDIRMVMDVFLQDGVPNYHHDNYNDGDVGTWVDKNQLDLVFVEF